VEWWQVVAGILAIPIAELRLLLLRRFELYHRFLCAAAILANPALVNFGLRLIN
jgi:hypothetical protein